MYYSNTTHIRTASGSVVVEPKIKKDYNKVLREALAAVEQTQAPDV